MDRIYLDANATTPVDPKVAEELHPYLTERFGNAASGHAIGLEAREALELARARVAEVIDAPPDRVFFTSGGSESCNWAIKGLAFARPDAEKRILIGATEHHAVEESAHWLARLGFVTEVLPVDGDGRVSPEAVRRSLKSRPALLVAVMWANNEVGTLEDVDAIGEVCRRASVPFLADAIQAIGKVPVEVSRAPVDFVPLGAHKFYGPKGVGALYVRRGLEIENLMHGAGHESGRRAGTSNVAGAVGMGVAASIAKARLAADAPRLERLRDRLESGLLATIEGARVNGGLTPRLPNTLNVSFDGVAAQDLLLALDRRGVAASAGAACRSGVHQPSPTLTAMGLSRDRAIGGVRFSLSRHSSDVEIDEAMLRISESVASVRQPAVRT